MDEILKLLDEGIDALLRSREEGERGSRGFMYSDYNKQRLEDFRAKEPVLREFLERLGNLPPDEIKKLLG